MIRYHVVLEHGADIEGLVLQVEGTLVSRVSRYDGIHDLALVDVKDGIPAEFFQALLDESDSVVSYLGEFTEEETEESVTYFILTQDSDEPSPWMNRAIRVRPGEQEDGNCGFFATILPKDAEKFEKLLDKDPRVIRYRVPA